MRHGTSGSSLAFSVSQLASRRRVFQKAGVKNEPPAKRPRRRLGRLRWWVLTLMLAGFGYQAWREYDYRAAVREAEKAGFHWTTTETFVLIRQDWRAALKKETWGAHPRSLYLGAVPDLGRYGDLLHRLRPTDLTVSHCENMDGLNGLADLQRLDLSDSPTLQNVDALKSLTGLERLDLYNCPSLQNVDGLKYLTNLRHLSLGSQRKETHRRSKPDYPVLKNVDGLKGLSGLQTLDLGDCIALQNVDALKSLTGLERLDLYNCRSLQNIDEMKGLTTLQSLNLRGCSALQNVDGLKSLTSLQSLLLGGCTSLRNVDGLKSLTALRGLELHGCSSLQNVDGLKGLSGLPWLMLYRSSNIPAAALHELRAALPKTNITFPDGSKSPPPENSGTP